MIKDRSEIKINRVNIFGNKCILQGPVHRFTNNSCFFRHSQIFQHHPRHERAQHEQRPVGKVDDAEHAEDDGEPQRQQCVERAVDQADQELRR